MIPGSDFAGLIVLGGETQQEGLRRDGGGGGENDAFEVWAPEHLWDTLVDAWDYCNSFKLKVEE